MYCGPVHSFGTRAGSDEKGPGRLKIKGHDHTFFADWIAPRCLTVCHGISRLAPHDAIGYLFALFVSITSRGIGLLASEGEATLLSRRIGNDSSEGKI